MNILYPSDKDQTEEINSLTYGQFRQRFPKLEGVKLPRPERLLKDAETLPALVAVDRDYVFAVYPDGICLCQRENKSTVYAVSGCARIVHRSATGVRYIIGEDETSDFPWFYPLLITGWNRLSENRESDIGREEKVRYGAGASGVLDALCHTPDFVTEGTSEDEIPPREQKRLRAEDLQAAEKCMTKRQWQIYYMHEGREMNLVDIARELGLGEPSVSITLKRARKRAKAFRESGGFSEKRSAPDGK